MLIQLVKNQYHTVYDVVWDSSVGTPVWVPSVQIGDLVRANYRKYSLRSGSTPTPNPAMCPQVLLTY